MLKLLKMKRLWTSYLDGSNGIYNPWIFFFCWIEGVGESFHPYKLILYYDSCSTHYIQLGDEDMVGGERFWYT